MINLSEDAPTIGHIERRFTDDGRLGGWLTPGEGEIVFTYNDNGQLETETDPSQRVTRYTYDNIGRVKTVTDESTGLMTEYHYDSLPDGIADPDPDVADNLFGRQSGQTIHLDADTSYTTAVTYYPDGQVKSSTDARNNTTFFSYTSTTTTVRDALARETITVRSDAYVPTEIQFADGTTQSNQYLFDNNLQEADEYPRVLTGRDGFMLSKNVLIMLQPTKKIVRNTREKCFQSFSEIGQRFMSITFSQAPH